MDKIIVNNLEFPISTFINELRKFNQAYRDGEPLITDKQYDKLVDTLKEQHPNHDWFWTIEPNENVSESRKTKLPIPMRSLYKALSFDELVDWMDKSIVKPDDYLLIMPKFDGASLLINDKTGQAYSRGGDENEGQICDNHIKRAGIKTDSDYGFTYGEFVINRDVWKNRFDGNINPKTGEPYRSPRNMAVGMLNSEIPPQTIEYAEIYRFGSSELDKYTYMSYMMRDICETYNQPYLFMTSKRKELNHDMLHDMYKEWNQLYPIDGLVVYVDDVGEIDRLGRHGSTGNPLYAMAYKADFEEITYSDVLSVTCEVSKNGYLRPTVQIESVMLADALISNPTGNNMRFIVDNRIAKGAVIELKRSGEVTPKILSVKEKPTDEDFDAMMNEFSRCPSCGCPTIWNDTGTDLKCVNSKCDGIVFSKIFHFFTCVGCTGVGKEVYSKLYSAGFKSIKEILDIDVLSITSIDGLGISTANTLLQINNKVKRGLELDLIMHASDCFENIGRKKASSLLSKFGASNINHLHSIQAHQPRISLSLTDIAFIDGLPEFFEFIRETNIPILSPEIKISVNKDGLMKGFNVCFTGIRDKELANFIKSEGGEVATSVSGKVTHLIAKDIEAKSKSVVRAKELNIPVLTINTFKETYF